MVGRTHRYMKGLRCIQATHVQCTASVPHEATNIHGNDDAVHLHGLLIDNALYMKSFATGTWRTCDLRAL